MALDPPPDPTHDTQVTTTAILISLFNLQKLFLVFYSLLILDFYNTET